MSLCHLNYLFLEQYLLVLISLGARLRGQSLEASRCSCQARVSRRKTLSVSFCSLCWCSLLYGRGCGCRCRDIQIQIVIPIWLATCNIIIIIIILCDYYSRCDNSPTHVLTSPAMLTEAKERQESLTTRTLLARIREQDRWGCPGILSSIDLLPIQTLTCALRKLCYVSTRVYVYPPLSFLLPIHSSPIHPSRSFTSIIDALG